MTEIKKGDKVKIVNDGYLPGNNVKPPIKKDEIYEISTQYVCNCGELHVDLGLTSEYNYVGCYKCKEQLPHGDIIHWVHSSRLEKIS